MNSVSMLQEDTRIPSLELAPPQKNSCIRSTVTVLMCDIVSSTRLSTSLPVETFRNLILDYYRICEDIVRSHNGIVVQYSGDGVLCVFGEPFVGDGTAFDAVCAGLSISQHQYSHLDCAYEIRVAASTGEIATGVRIGSVPTLQDTIFGAAPYLVSRLQSVAPPGSLIVDQNTFEKTKPQFNSRWMGYQDLRGFEHPQPAWQVQTNKQK